MKMPWNSFGFDIIISWFAPLGFCKSLIQFQHILMIIKEQQCARIRIPHFPFPVTVLAQ